MLKRLTFFACSLLFFAPTTFLFAQNIITDRPDQTESAVTLEKGRLQIESGILNQIQGDGNDKLKSLIIPTNLFRYGISKKVELRLVLQLDGLQTMEDNADAVHEVLSISRLRKELGDLNHMIEKQSEEIEAKNQEISINSTTNYLTKMTMMGQMHQ